MRIDANGKEVRHGPCQAWSASGSLLVDGKFENDRKKGRWQTFHGNREKAAEGSFSSGLHTGLWETFHPNGRRASKGRYRAGQRAGPWRFWKDDGTEDPLHSGEYTGVSEERTSHSDRGYSGELLDGQRHGEWVSTWPEGRTQLIASYSRGQREGPWRFYHQDGSRSSLLLSGRYHAGHWVEPLPADFAEPEAESFGRPAVVLSLLSHFEAPLEDARCTAVLAALLEASEAEVETARQATAQQRAHPDWTDSDWIPQVLARMRLFDPDQPEGRRAIGRLDAVALRALCHGHGLSSFVPEGPPDAASARDLVQSWLSLWSLRGSEAWYWRLDLRYGTAPDTLAEGRDWLQEPDPLEYGRLELPKPLRRPTTGELRSTLGASGEQALKDALAWLRDHQSPDGSWSSQNFPAECVRRGQVPCEGIGTGYDVGLTALALLAFLGDGNTLEAGVHQGEVLRGIEWLLEQQDLQSGLFRRTFQRGEKVSRYYRSETHEQAYATRALCEALAATPSRALRERATLAVQLLLRARNPYGGWRYEIPADGSNDTAVTGEVVVALATAAAVGLEGDLRSAFEGASSWIDEVSDPATGRIGYDAFNTLPARMEENLNFPREKSEAPTALGLLGRVLLGQRPENTSIMAKHAQLIVSKRPIWDPEGLGNDMYYWYYATSALYQMGKPWWPEWQKSMKSAVADSQSLDDDAKGSWDPVGPWGCVGGRVYSTAMMALCLEAGLRYEWILGPDRAR